LMIYDVRMYIYTRIAPREKEIVKFPVKATQT